MGLCPGRDGHPVSGLVDSVFLTTVNIYDVLYDYSSGVKVAKPVL